MNLSRAEVFVLILGAAYLLPLAIPNVGLDWPYFFVMVIVLFAWFIIKWSAVQTISNRSARLEIVAGISAIGTLYAWKAVQGSPVGILDLLILFLIAAVVSFGLKSLRHFWVPAAYGVVLLAGYHVENAVPNYADLQNWLAGVMANAMNSMGIGAKAIGHIVSIDLPNGSTELLSVEGACTGLQGILAFGMLSTMALLDLKPNPVRLALIIGIGFAGAFLTNILRLLVVFLTFEYLGVDAGLTMHVYFGYLIFFAWVLGFWAIAFRYLVPRNAPITGGLTLTKPSSV